MKDSFLPVRISATNGDFSGSTEAKIYPDEFKYFAQRLTDFPREAGDQVFFSSGGDDDAWESYLYLGIQTLESTGGLALQVRLRRNEPEQCAGGAAFFIPLCKEEINCFGRELVEWLVSDREDISYEFSSPQA